MDALPTSRVDVDVAGAVLACAAHRVDPDGFTLVHFHGNGEVVADWQGVLDRAVNGLGWNLFLAEYRGYGGSTGEPLLGRMLDDVDAVVAASGAPEKLVVMGRSVGSIFALEAVRRFPAIAGLVLESAIADPLDRVLLRVSPTELGASRLEFEDLEELLDHRAKIAGYTGPTLVLHTLLDGLVDVDNARRLARWAGSPVTLRVFPEGDHNSILAENGPEYFTALGDFLRAVSGG